MFFVFNKQKILSYIVAFSMVAILVGGANFFISPIETTVETVANMDKLVPIYKVDTEEKNISLTINCAWNADDIDSILKTLEDEKIKVTFFMVGDWVDKYPEAVKKISDAGHEIANHSNTHPHVNNLTLEKNIDQIKSCSDKIEKITGKKTYLYRGPYGEYNDIVIKAAEEANHIAIQWTVDTLDYTGLTEEQMRSRLNGKIENGSIILMHNGTTHTAESLGGIIKKIKEQGFNVIPVSELIYKENYEIDSNGVQKRIK